MLNSTGANNSKSSAFETSSPRYIASELSSLIASAMLHAVTPIRRRGVLRQTMHLDVVGFISAERRRRRNRIAKQQTACINRNEQPFVRIERNGIRAFEPGKQFGFALVPHNRRAVRTVNVHPQIKLARHVSNVRQRINCYLVSGSRVANHTK